MDEKANTVKMRVNAPRSGTILQVKRDEKRRPEAFTTIPGRFRKKKKNGAFGSTGRYKKQEKGHTFLKRGAIIDTKEQDKKVDTSHTDTPTSRQQQVLIVSQPSSTDKAPSTDKSSSCSEVCLRR